MEHKGTVILETERLILRPFSIEDLTQIYENCWSDREVWKWTNYAPMHSMDDVINVANMFNERWLGAYKDPKRYSWAIQLKETGEVIGRYFGMNPDDELCQVELTCEIGPTWWNQGLMTEATKRIIKFFFEEVGMNRIYAYHASGNPASGKVQQKSEMQMEGILRQACKCNNGVFDKVMYAILATDYFKKESNRMELIEPSMKYADEIWNFRQEIIDVDVENEDQFAGCLSLDSSESAEEWVNICALRKNEETCEQVGTNVPSHTYLAVRKSDDKVVGVIDLRHHINHPILGTWGGHCGYSVRPSERGKGYAKEMLRLNIQNAKALGIPKLLITCNVTNEASEKTILANGGVFENTIDVDGTTMKRYWLMVS